MDPARVEQFRQRMENQQRVIIEACTKALTGEMSLAEAVLAIEQSDPKSQDSIYVGYPEIEPLCDLSEEVEWFPEEREAIEAVYRERAHVLLRWLLEEFLGIEHTVEIKVDSQRNRQPEYLWQKYLAQQKEA